MLHVKDVAYSNSTKWIKIAEKSHSIKYLTHEQGLATTRIIPISFKFYACG